MELHGHAGYSEPGTDIVCSACTMQCYSLAEHVSRYNAFGAMKADPVIILDSGEIVIECSPLDEFWGAVEIMFDQCRIGFELLANTYPDNVRIPSFDTGTA